MNLILVLTVRNAGLGYLTPRSLIVLIRHYRDFWAEQMPDLDLIRAEIEHMRVQIGRQRKEMLQLQRAGIPTASAEALLERMLAKVDGLVEQRDRLKQEAKLKEPSSTSGKRIHGPPAHRRA